MLVIKISLAIPEPVHSFSLPAHLVCNTCFCMVSSEEIRCKLFKDAPSLWFTRLGEKVLLCIVLLVDGKLPDGTMAA